MEKRSQSAGVLAAPDDEEDALLDLALFNEKQIGSKDTPREIGTPMEYDNPSACVICLVISIGTTKKIVLCKPDTTIPNKLYSFLDLVAPNKTRPTAQAKPQAKWK